MNSIKSLSSVGRNIHAGALALAAIAVASVSSLSGEPQPGPVGPAFVGLGAFNQPFPQPAGNSFARGLSANGKVVVGYVKSGPSSNPVEHAFRWSKNDGMQSIPQNPPYTNSEATAVSANGEIIVGNHGLFPFRWTLAGGTVNLPLGAPPSGATSPAGRAWGVSGDGNVLVGERYACKFFGDSSWWATRWVGQTPPADLGHLPEVVSPCDDRFARALGASADGSTIVGQTFVDIDLPPFAFRWNASDGVMTKLEAFEATAVSADGTVIVGSGPAFRWTQASGMEAMDHPPGAASTYALAVSPDGSVVAGKATLSDGSAWSEPLDSYEAMIWDTEGTVRWLQPWLEQVDGMPDELQDWTLHEVVGVGASSDWLYLAGNGTNPDGEFEAWWARVPKPGPDFTPGTFRVPLLFDREPYIIICDLIGPHGPYGPHGSVRFDVLGLPEFDLRNLDQGSIRFGNAPGSRATQLEFRDVNRDGFTDLSLQFNLEDVFQGLDWRNTHVLRFHGASFAGTEAFGEVLVQMQIR